MYIQLDGWRSLRLVGGDAFGDRLGSNIECGSDSGGASHMGNGWFTGEKTGNSVSLVTSDEASFGAFAIEL